MAGLVGLTAAFAVFGGLLMSRLRRRAVEYSVCYCVTSKAELLSASLVTNYSSPSLGAGH